MRLAPLAVALLLLAPSIALAQGCPMCRRALESGGGPGLIRGYYLSILIITSVPLALLAAIGGLVLRSARRRAAAALVAAAALGAGCDTSHADVGIPPGPEVAAIKEAPVRGKIAQAVDAAFGVPEAPKAPAVLDLDLAKVARGREVYTALCIACHGVNGDGAGPAAPYLEPRPRDFRRGVFKFTTTMPSAKALREDLVATISRGIPGAKMPAFVPHGPAKIGDVAELVLWMATRGDLERRLAARADSDGDLDADAVSQCSDDLAADWKNARAGLLVIPPMPPATPELLKKGRELFLSEGVKCFSCHGAEGRGDGASGKGLKDDWGNPIAPRDFTSGVFRRGQRPDDIYRTIACGVKGTPMPGFGSGLQPDDIWALAQFVRSLTSS